LRRVGAAGPDLRRGRGASAWQDGPPPCGVPGRWRRLLGRGLRRHVAYPILCVRHRDGATPGSCARASGLCPRQAAHPVSLVDIQSSVQELTYSCPRAVDIQSSTRNACNSHQSIGAVSRKRSVNHLGALCRPKRCLRVPFQASVRRPPSHRGASQCPLPTAPDSGTTVSAVPAWQKRCGQRHRMDFPTVPSAVGMA